KARWGFKILQFWTLTLKIVKIQKNFFEKISVIFEPKYSEKRTICLLVGKINRIYDIYVRQ
ncbi:hypothetical protein, partial [Lactobacillus helveticus]|uniref:hypothetical protein n=1 Tax=Lactobacillus helveticus TaxID=1587 RepID=UPI001C273904